MLPLTNLQGQSYAPNRYFCLFVLLDGATELILSLRFSHAEKQVGLHAKQDARHRSRLLFVPGEVMTDFSRAAFLSGSDSWSVHPCISLSGWWRTLTSPQKHKQVKRTRKDSALETWPTHGQKGHQNTIESSFASWREGWRCKQRAIFVKTTDRDTTSVLPHTGQLKALQDHSWDKLIQNSLR